MTIQAPVEDAQHLATAVHSHSSTKVVVITAVQEKIASDPGAPQHPIMIETRNGATVLNVRSVCINKPFHSQEKMITKFILQNTEKQALHEAIAQ